MDSAVRPAAAAAADEEEARRRNTDCIYFLASPLTCKKGSECEYRHSDAARVNPRDCWYWFNGNCTNPKCAFRHPPLDDLLGAPATPRAAQPPVPQVSGPAQAPGSVPGSGTAKQGVPCYYFQKGTCLKGNKCAFLHVQQTAGSIDSQQTAKASTPLQAHPQLKNTWMMKACTKPNSSAQQNTPAAAVDKLRINGQNGKPAQKQNPTTSADYSSGAYQNHHLANHSYVLTSTAENYQPQRSVEQDLAENGMEVGEFVREPSAGMGVLVGGTDDTTNHSFMEEDNSHRHSNGELATKYERELRTRMLRHTHNSYEVERPERSSTVSGRRISQRDLTHHACDSSDLRHRLRKQRQLNDTRSAQVTDRHDEYLEERSCDNRHWQDEEQVIRDTLSRSRLHGRIKRPGVTSSDGVGFLSEKERDRGPRVRLSPPKQTDLRGKLHSRLGARLNEDIPGNAKGLRVKPNTVEDTGSMNFAGPKTLAELKASKVADFSQEQASKRASSSAGLGRVSSEIVAVQESSGPVPFEGPKPLNVILKRKREATSENATHFDSIQDKHAVKEEEPQNKFGCLEEDVVSMDTKGKGEEEASFHPEDDMAYDDSLSPVDDNVAGTGVIADQELEPPQDLEPAEEYDYGAADGNAEEDNEYQEDEDDDDDFARKVGVMIS